MEVRQTILTNGSSRAVVINEQDGLVWANLYVNARDGIANASITPLRWSGRTMKGAKRWAETLLAE